jgi:hypothetical protein
MHNQKRYFALRFDAVDFFDPAAFFAPTAGNAAFVRAFCWRRISAAAAPRPMPRARLALLSHMLKKGFFIGLSDRVFQDHLQVDPGHQTSSGYERSLLPHGFRKERN